MGWKMSNKCNNPEIGRYLHAFELEILPEDKRTLFEEHLLSCSFCFQEVEAMKQPLEILEQQIDRVKNKTIRKEHPVTSPFRNFMEWLNTGFLKPAYLLIIILLLIYPAYLGINSNSGKNDIVTVQEFSLHSLRGIDDQTFHYDSHKDLVLNFICPEISDEKKYDVKLFTDDSLILVDIPEFDGFDKYNTGRVCLPQKSLADGRYYLEISSMDKKETYQFPFNLKTKE